MHACTTGAAPRAGLCREVRDGLACLLTVVHACPQQAEHPALLDAFEAFAARAAGKRLAVFLDYDGTLTPIVKNPDRAFMSDQVSQTHACAPCPRPCMLR